MNFKERLVGLEFENPLLRADGTIINQEDIQKFWNAFIKEGDERDADYLTGVLVGAKKKLSNGKFESLNTDTGVTTLEMSLSPCKSLDEAKKNYDEVRTAVLGTAKKLGFRYLGYAIWPRTFVGKNPYDYKTKKSLYAALNLPRHNLQLPITAHQTGISLRADEVLSAINTLQALSGTITCLSANSPIFEDKIMPWKETRLVNWNLTSTSAHSQGEMDIFAQMPSRPFTSLADYFKYIWRTTLVLPMLRNGQWVKPNQKLTPIEYLKGTKWPAKDLFGKDTELEPTLSDLNLLSICSWMDAKPHLVFKSSAVTLNEFLKNLEADTLDEYIKGRLVNCYMEYRIGGSSPAGEELALPALSLGLVNNLKRAEKLVAKYSWADWRKLRGNSYITGMGGKIGNDDIVPVLQELAEIAQEGLKMRSMGEEKYLEPVNTRIMEKKNPADKCIEVFKEKGMGGLLDYVTYTK